jgi:hypothetical protein
MFESALLDALYGDTELCGYVSQYTVGESTVPAIFSEVAPKDASLPYIVFKIARSAADSPAMQKFNIYIDYYDYDKSMANSRKAADRIEFILDRANLEHDRYGCIRVFFFSGGSVPDDDDPRSIHYNMLFEARAGRKKWADGNITTLGN